jgi:hypothetical protein
VIVPGCITVVSPTVIVSIIGIGVNITTIMIRLIVVVPIIVGVIVAIVGKARSRIMKPSYP